MGEPPPLTVVHDRRTASVRTIAERDPARPWPRHCRPQPRRRHRRARGWEEAAVAAATRGDHALARTCAVRCTELATVLGASGVRRRLTGRLRDARIGVSGSRKRPATGWRSLTPTELQVAELVGQGLTSPQIATRLYLSPGPSRPTSRTACAS